MMDHLSSRTMVGLVVILAIAVGMSLCGKLTAELADILKYVGGFFLLSRGAVGVAESLPKAKKDG